MAEEAKQPCFNSTSQGSTVTDSPWLISKVFNLNLNPNPVYEFISFRLQLFLHHQVGKVLWSDSFENNPRRNLNLNPNPDFNPDLNLFIR